jgi:hypothetical protein
MDVPVFSHLRAGAGNLGASRGRHGRLRPPPVPVGSNTSDHTYNTGTAAGVFCCAAESSLKYA